MQLYAFAVCALAGACGGVLYEGVAALRFFVKNASARIAADILFFLAFAAVFVLLAAAFYLPDLRFYMFAACAFGFLLYRKSLHRILAFFARRLYNKCRKIPKEISAGACDERR